MVFDALHANDNPYFDTVALVFLGNKFARMFYLVPLRRKKMPPSIFSIKEQENTTNN